MEKQPIKLSEAEYRRCWIDDHDGADEMVYDPKTKQPVSATYFYPPHHHAQEIKNLFSEAGEK